MAFQEQQLFAKLFFLSYNTLIKHNIVTKYFQIKCSLNYYGKLQHTGYSNIEYTMSTLKFDKLS